METWAPGITAIKTADLGDSPAAVNRETGVMYVNPDFDLDADQWYFIMLHEMGHLVQQTKDELTADAWAHKQYLKDKNRSLKKSVFALTDLLQFNKAEDFARAKMQLKRAQRADTPNKTIMYTNTGKYYGQPKCDPDYSVYFNGGANTISSDFDADKSEYFADAIAAALINTGGSLLGGLFGGKSEDRSATGYNNAIAQRQPLPYYPTKLEMIRASQSWEGHIKAAINDAYDEQTGTWESPSNDWKGIVTSVAPISAMLYKGASERFPVRSSVYAQPKPQSIASSIFGGSSNNATPGAPGSSNKTLLIVGIAIAVVVVVVGVVLAIRKR